MPKEGPERAIPTSYGKKEPGKLVRMKENEANKQERIQEASKKGKTVSSEGHR